MKKLFVLLFGILFFANLQAQAGYEHQFKVKVGDMAPDFEITLLDGNTVRLSSLRGKVIMLQFISSWSSICRMEMPHIEENIWQKHKNNPKFALYAIDPEEPAEVVSKFAKKTNVTYPIGLDPSGEVFSLYAQKGAGVTRNVIIDKDGKIVMYTKNFNMEEFNRMVALIDSLLAK